MENIEAHRVCNSFGILKEMYKVWKTSENVLYWFVTNQATIFRVTLKKINKYKMLLPHPEVLVY